MGMDGGFTLGNVRSVLEGAGVGNVDVMVGQMTERFSQQAQALGLGNVREADRFIETLRTENVLDDIRSRAAGRVELQNLFEGRGALSAFQSLQQAVSGGELTADSPLSSLFGIIGGKRDINPGDIFDTTKETVAAINKIEDKRRRVTARAGLGTAAEAVLFGRVGNRSATTEEIERARNLLTNADKMSEEDRMRSIMEFAEEIHKDDIFQFEVDERAQELFEDSTDKDKKGAKGPTKKHKDLARKQLILEQIKTQAERDNLKTVAGKGKDAESSFAKNAADLLAMFENATGDQTSDDIMKQFFADKGGDDAQREFMAQVSKEGLMNESVAQATRGGLADAGMSKIAAILETIKDILEENTGGRGDGGKRD
jgi:hypothetical protein